MATMTEQCASQRAAAAIVAHLLMAGFGSTTFAIPTPRGLSLTALMTYSA
jgi:hypothetical protein